MGIRRGLLLYLLRRTLLTTAVAAAIACLYALLNGQVLRWRDGGPVAFVVVHSLVLTQLTGRFRTGRFAFLYTRGYSRDQLWAHTMLASLLSVLAVWLPAALILWTGLRSGLQDWLLGSPHFPVMAPVEAAVPIVWLAGYAICLPPMHYAWIRAAQPTRGGVGGAFLAAAVLLAALTVISVNPRGEWFRWVALGAGGVTAAAALLAGRKLHQRLEVQA